MKFAFGLLLLLAIASGFALAKVEKADKTFLRKQLSVLKLTWRLSSPLEDAEQVAISKSWIPMDHLAEYTNPETVTRFFGNLHKWLKRGEIFSLFEPAHCRQMIDLFEILHFATSWDLFYKTAVFAREVTNEGQFFYAFSAALLHREEGFVLPPLYEVFPHFFTTSDVIREAYRAQVSQTPAVIPMNFTGTVLNPEQRVAYFGEDIGMNAYLAHWHLDMPFWWNKEKYGALKDRKGELFWYMHHQLSARYNAERLSNNLNTVDELRWDKPIVEGYSPKTQYKSGGHEFPSRPDNMNFEDLPFLTVNDMKLYEDRIRNAVAAGFVYDRNGEKVPINGTDGIDILGSILEASADSLNYVYYGSLHNNAHVMLSRVTDPKGKFGMKYGVLEHFETATRDPAFFRIHRYTDRIFKEHKDLLPPYTPADLEVPGVIVDEIKVIGRNETSIPNTLVTYFKDFYYNVSNALETSKDVEDVVIQVKVRRLTHEPFDYVITTRSQTEKFVVARIFVAPNYDYYGQRQRWNQLRWEAIELDKFVMKLEPGQNVIHRPSENSSVTIPDRKGFMELFHDVNDAISGARDYYVDKNFRHCGLPEGLLIPKGKPEGMIFKLFVYLSDFDKDFHAEHYIDSSSNSLSYCGNVMRNGLYPDKKPMGFPFDRVIPCGRTFRVDNMKYTEITIQNVPN